MAKLPLEGIRVVDITVVWAGPFGTQLLADWGAEVIRVESRQRWQFATRGFMAHPPKSMFTGPGGLTTTVPNREPGERPWNRFSFFNAHARNKLSMTVDLTRPEGLDIFRRLVKASDLVMENNAAGTLDSLGIGYSALKEWKPDIILISMPGLGTTGPRKDWRAYGSQLESYIGHTLLRGYPDADVTANTPTMHCDAVGGAAGAFAALAALHYRNRTGNGQFVDLAQIEASIPQFGELILDWTMNQRLPATAPGNRHPSAIQGCYKCKGEDRWVDITIPSDEEWNGFCQALGNPPWTKEERFSDVLSRHKNHDDLDRLIEGWTLQHDNYEVMHILQGHGVPAGPVMTERDIFNDPNYNERDFFEEVTQADCGTHLYPGIAWKLSKTPNSIRTPPCLFGEHNEYVYKKVIGVSDEEYAGLMKAGHIGTDFVAGIP